MTLPVDPRVFGVSIRHGRLIRAGTEIRCKDPACSTVIATFRIDRYTTDRPRREDFIFPAAWPMPMEGAKIQCPKCKGPPEPIKGEDPDEIENQNSA